MNFSIGETQYKENIYNDDANRYYSCAARLVFLSSGVSRPGPIPENSNGEYGERGWGEEVGGVMSSNTCRSGGPQ